MTFLSRLILCALFLAGQSFGGARAQTITPGAGPGATHATTNFVGHLQTNALDVLSKTAALSRFNNAHIGLTNGNTMPLPPVVTVSATHNAAYTVNFGWNGANNPTSAYGGTGAYNFYGGTVKNDLSGAMVNLSVNASSTTNGPLTTSYILQTETNVDAQAVEFKFLATGPIFARFIVNGQYINYSSETLPSSGLVFITLDFTTVGGRAIRDIRVECEFCHFYGAAVSPTEDMFRPDGPVKTVLWAGDSMTVGFGADRKYNGFIYYTSDYLGFRNPINNGVQGTGYTVAAGQTTCGNRVQDIFTLLPDLIIISCGYNDTGSTPAAVTAAALAMFQAIRANAATANTPIIVTGLWTARTSALSTPTETAIMAAVTAMNDPLIIGIPTEIDPNGAWVTGTGPNGGTGCPAYVAGNAAVVVSSADCVHPSTFGHQFYAWRLAGAIAKMALVP